MPRPALLLALGALCLVSATAAPQEQREEVEHPEVVELDFTGVEVLSEEELRGSISTQETRCKSPLFRIFLFCTLTTSPVFLEKHYLDRAELARDLLRLRILYWRSGFRETTVDTAITPLTESGDKVRVTLSLTEGPPTLVSSVRVIRPPDVLDDGIIERLMQVRAGQPLDLADLDTSFVGLRDALWERGYSDAVIDTSITVTNEARTAAVEITIDPRWRATVGDIVIAGNERVGARTILNSLTLSEGDIYRRSDVIRSQRNLYESGLFQHAAIVVPPRGDTTKLIEVTVREAPLQMVRVSGGFNTVAFVQFESRYTNYNWFGRARRLEVRGQIGNLLARQLNGRGPFRNVEEQLTTIEIDPFLRPNWQASIDLRQPWFQSPLNTIAASLFGHRRSSPGAFADRGYGVSTTFTRELAIRSTASANYRFELTRLEATDVYLCVNFGVCDTQTVEALQGEQRMSPLSLSFTADRSDNLLSPTRGYRARGEIEHASGFTISDFRYNRVSAEGTLYRSFGRSVLAGRLRLGAVRALGSTAEAVGIVAPEGEPVLHPRRRFYAGGSQSVRGYGENQLGPRVLTIDPDKLENLGCDVSYETVASCNPNNAGTDPEGNQVLLEDSDFLARPLGGTSVAEASVELRFPIWRELTGAVFVDGAIVGERNTLSLGGSTAAVTPGFGVRYTTPIGPVRVDLGVNPCLAERLTVLTEAIGPSGRPEIIPLEHQRVFAPACRGTGIRGILNRLQLHLSIGQAY